jgi:hypothetical protein
MSKEDLCGPQTRAVHQAHHRPVATHLEKRFRKILTRQNATSVRQPSTGGIGRNEGLPFF